MVRLKVQFIIIYNTARISLNRFYEPLCHLLFKKKIKKVKTEKEKNELNLLQTAMGWSG